MEQNPKTMTQAELRSYLRERKSNDEINFTNPDSEKHWTPFVNGQLAGFGVDALRIVAQTWMFPPEGYVLPSAGDPQPEPERKPLVRKKEKPAISREDLIEILTGSSGDSLDEQDIRRIVDDQVTERLARGGMPEKKIIITPVSKVKIDEVVHEKFEDVTTIIGCGENAAIVGGAGTGKTFMAELIAKALDLDFYFTGKVDTEHQLIGYRDAHGQYFETAFFKAFTKGGLFLWDEFDASSPRAATRFNSAIANRICDFPTGNYKAHENFRVIAASNTYWSGATRDYVGRNEMDKATKDRFVFVDVDYDTKVENAIASQYTGGLAIAKRVQAVRGALQKLKIRHIVSMRATVSVAKLINAGFSQEKAEKYAMWKDLSAEQIAKIEALIGGAK